MNMHGGKQPRAAPELTAPLNIRLGNSPQHFHPRISQLLSLTKFAGCETLNTNAFNK